MVRLKDYGATLYNLKDDLGETRNLSELYASEFELLQDELINWESQMMDPLWLELGWMDYTYYVHQQLMENKEVVYKGPKQLKESRIRQ